MAFDSGLCDSSPSTSVFHICGIYEANIHLQQFLDSFYYFFLPLLFYVKIMISSPFAECCKIKYKTYALYIYAKWKLIWSNTLQSISLETLLLFL